MNVTKTKPVPEAGVLLDVVALDHNGVLVTSEGALVRIAEVTPCNPRVMGAAQQQRVSEGLATMAGRLSPGQCLQFYVEASPVLLNDVLSSTRAIRADALKAQPWQRRDALEKLGEAHDESLTAHSEESAAVRFRVYVVMPFVPDGPLKRVDWDALRKRQKMPRAPLQRSLQQHKQAVRQSLTHMENVTGDLEALGLAALPLTGPEVAELLFRRFNPSSVSLGYKPPHRPRKALDDVTDARTAARVALQLRDQIAASPISLDDSRFIQVEQDLERVLYVSKVSDFTEFGWLLEAMEIDRPFAMSVFVHALDRLKERNRIRTQRRRLYGINKGTELAGKVPDIEMEAKEDETSELLEEMRGKKRTAIYDVSIYQTVREPGPDPDRMALVEASERAVSAIRDAADADAKFAGFIQRELWQSTLPLGRDVARLTRKYVSRNVGDTIPLVGPSCGSPEGIPLFFSEGVRTLLNFNPWDQMMPNGLMVVGGQQGAGKTMWAVITVSQLLAHGVFATILDRSGHYELLTQLIPGAAHLSIGGINSTAMINPWDVPDCRSVAPEKIRFIRGWHELALGGDITDDEKNLLSEGIRAVYGLCGRQGNRSPLERDLQAELRRLELEDREAAHGQITQRATILGSLATRLGRFVRDGEDAFLADRETTVPPDAPLVVFDTRPAGEHLALAMLTAMEYTVTQNERRAGLRGEDRRLFPGDALFSDETWAVLEDKVAGAAFHDVQRRSRHRGLFFCAMSQAPVRDFDSYHGRQLLESAHMRLFFSQGEAELRGVQDALRLSDNEVELISRLNTSRGRYSRAYWMNGPRGRGEVSVRLGGVEYWLATSEPTVDVPLRRAALERHWGDPWAALRELADGGTVR